MMRDVSIRLGTHPGDASIVIDGQDVTRFVMGLRVVADPGSITVVGLDMPATVTVDGECEVYVGQGFSAPNSLVAWYRRARLAWLAHKREMGWRK